MSREKAEQIIILATAVFFALTVGYFAGSASGGEQISIETSKGSFYTREVQISSEQGPVLAGGNGEAEAAGAFPGVEAAPAADGGLININTATADELVALSGIGEVLARRIVDYRLQFGLFIDIEEIMEVDGIGAAKFDKIKDSITVG